MNEQFWSPVKLSIEVASLSLLIVFVLGIGIARLTANRRFKGQSLMDTVLLLPLVLPPSVVGFLLIIIFGRQSPIGQGIEWVFHQPIMFTWWAAVIAATVVAFPLMYQSAKSGFETIDREIEDASRVDGANERQVFLLVTVPLASRAIVTGAILSFARALGEFGATLMFAGNIPGRTQTIPTAIYIAMDAGNMELAWLWVLTILVISFTMLLVLNVFKKQG
ncbi:molybdate ABC transporter permease subunit [Halalkalibacterium halodurans]|uniref:Molybdenum transport system permease n=1 Tax=Halalkalibacterium halodurans TaxID=86665 RepID=A0A0M0KMT1_ALKHA|nr:molybdate ABC transporter permease subunit [Halalkalibacterium halodurans]MDY7223861.1 molybdate ABC transporter permease subunit [Halalkalibacterium halodurans]MDY7243082.1 molybdate ABC transporter permease subunit [Halalkalibacterium halodurans]MED3647134.1 molybdate ABC transporter permease subunit [Halalkalibacterium halodurans]MED4161474.1 molybdate ABC transporter permease subunit [Halalkalibacterium halodurans]TPE68662.1 molybdate ABC transporter permease subunit [Halalkalibacterium